MFRRLRGGFTLIEILIVVAIISVLVAVIYGRLSGGTPKARDASREADIGQLALAFRLYAEQNGAFPSYNSGTRVGEGTSLDGKLEDFIHVSHDPSGPGDSTYFYYYDSSYNCPIAGGTSVVLFASSMENESKGNWSQVCNSNGPEERYGIILN